MVPPQASRTRARTHITRSHVAQAPQRRCVPAAAGGLGRSWVPKHECVALLRSPEQQPAASKRPQRSNMTARSRQAAGRISTAGRGWLPTSSAATGVSDRPFYVSVYGVRSHQHVSLTLHPPRSRAGCGRDPDHFREQRQRRGVSYVPDGRRVLDADVSPLAATAVGSTLPSRATSIGHAAHGCARLRTVDKQP